MGLIFGIIVGIFILISLVVIHELGHAIVARRNGVVVKEFGIGFPPKAWSRKLKNGVEFSLNYLPLGGFVRLQGEHDAARGPGDYGAASFWFKTKILLAGVAINWLAAAGLLTILALVGMPQLVPDQFKLGTDAQLDRRGGVTVSKVLDNYPAQQAGIKDGDELKQFAGKDVESVEQVIKLSHDKHGQTVPVVVKRDGEIKRFETKLKDDQQGSVFGAGLSEMQLIRSTWSAPIVGVGTTAQFSWLSLKGLGVMIGDLASGLVGKLSPDEAARKAAGENLHQVSQGVSGPIGILGVLFPSFTEAGLIPIIFLTALISLSLALMNFLPIPALDGGRWWTMTIFRLLKKPLTKEREENIQATGFLFILILVVLVTFSDVAKIIN